MKTIAATTILILVLFAVEAPVQADVRIEVKEEAAVDGKFVRLADIAEITGDEPATVARIKRIFCGMAPHGEGQRLVSLFYLKARLNQSGICSDDIFWCGARGCRLAGYGQFASHRSAPWRFS